jgi:hypothetical protein
MAVTLLTPALVAQAKQDAAGNTTNKTFKVATDAKIHAADGKVALLTDLKVGDKVGLAYTDSNGTLTADKIHVIGEPKAEPGAKKGEDHKGAKSDTELHARGVITAIDTAAGTIAVDVQQHHKKQ